jgi:hypothetical protein
MKTLLWIIGVCSVLILASCKLIADSAPPYVVSKPGSYCVEKSGYYVFAGIEFSFLNTSEKAVTDITVSCMVFEPETLRNPLIGSNIIKTSFAGYIPGGRKKDLIISLDPYIYAAPEKPYIIDFFYIARIVYDDGSSWEDPNGIYYTGG